MLKISNLYERTSIIKLDTEPTAVLIVGEGVDFGSNFTNKIKINPIIKYAYTPLELRVLYKDFKFNYDLISKSYRNGETVVSDFKKVKDKSFYMDITGQLKYLHNKLDVKSFIKDGAIHVEKICKLIKDNTNVKKIILVYYIDPTVLSKSIILKDLYSLPFLYNVADKSIAGLNEVYINTPNSVIQIYDSTVTGNFESVIKIVSSILKPDEIEQEETKEVKKENLPSANIDDLNDDIIKETKKVSDDLTKAGKVTSKNLNYSDEYSTKVSVDIAKQSLPFLKGLGVDVKTAISKVNMYVTSNPEAMLIAKQAYENDDIEKAKSIVKAALSDINIDNMLVLVEPDPKKNESFKAQEKIVDEMGLKETYTDDALSKAALKSNPIKNNIANVISRRVNTEGYLKRIILESIKMPLEEIGYSVKDITFTTSTTSEASLNETIMQNVNIKVTDPDGNKEIIVFKIPKLTEDRYILSGGLRWYYPTIISTIPIFVVRPGEVQLRTNYSSLMFHYGLFNRIETVQVYVGGFKIPLTLFLSLLIGLDKTLKQFNIDYIITDENLRDANITKLKLGEKFLNLKGNDNDVHKKVIINGLLMMFKAFPFTSLESTDEMFDCLKALTKQNKSEYVIRQVFKYIIDVHTREVLKSRELPIDLKGIILYSTDLAISGENEDKLDLNNIYLRTFDIIAAGVEKGIHNAVSIYKRAKIFKPNVKLSVKSNFVIQFFMEQGVLQLLQYQNPVEEISAYASARIVGPGGLPNADAVQPKDRGLRSSHFGNFDPTDTSEGDPGTRLYLTSGHFYDTNVNSFLKMENSDSNKNIFGPAASLTPFGDKDDQARLNMASNQARQAVPILSSEPPMVGSGYESNVAALCSGTFTKKAKANGKVEYVDKNVIIVTYEDGKKESLDIRPTNLISGSGLDSALTYEVGVKVGDKVSKDQMLATNQFIKPVLSQGVNAKTCYLSYMGYNYEDGLIISQSLADKMTSIHYDSIESSIYVNDIIDVFPQIGQEFNTGETVFKLKKHVIAGASLADTYEVTAPSKLKVFDIEVYPVDRDSLKHITSQIEENYRDSNEALRSHGLKPVFDMERIVKYTGKWEEDGEKLKYSKVVIKMLRYMNMSLGDKASNRHAAKVRRSIS